MPRIKLHGLAETLKGVQGCLNTARNSLLDDYAKAVDEISQEIARDAQANLGKPNWELSKAIRASRTKVYDRRTVFQAIEAEGSLDQIPNTPGAYAFYHEYGYVVSAESVKRPKPGKFIDDWRREHKSKAAYRITEGRRFFQKAADQNIPKLQEKIDAIHDEYQWELVQ